MSSGGARGNAGRVADPAALRRDRAGDSATWTVLAPFDGGAPEWPLAESELLGHREMAIWNRLWKKPQASEWLRLGLEDEVALYCRYLAEAELPGAKAAVRTLVKQHQELLGLSTAGLTRLRWTMPAGESSEAPRSASERRSSRTRLKVVGNGE